MMIITACPVMRSLLTSVIFLRSASLTQVDSHPQRQRAVVEPVSASYNFTISHRNYNMLYLETQESLRLQNK